MKDQYQDLLNKLWPHLIKVHPHVALSVLGQTLADTAHNAGVSREEFVKRTGELWDELKTLRAKGKT